MNQRYLFYTVSKNELRFYRYMRWQEKIQLGAMTLLDFVRLWPRARRFDELDASERNGRSGRPRALLLIWDRLGDLTLYLAFAQKQVAYLRDLGYDVDVLVNGAFQRLALEALQSCGVREVLAFDCKAFFHSRRFRRTLLNRLREGRYALSINPRIYREFWVDDLLNLAAAAPRRIGIDAGMQAISVRLCRWGNRFYTDLMALPDAGRTALSMNRTHWAFSEFWMGKTAMAHYFAPEQVQNHSLFEPSRALPEAWRKKLDSTPRWAAVIPGATDPWRQWPPERFAEVMSALAQAGKIDAVLLLGTAGEAELGSRLEAALQEQMIPVWNLIGQTQAEQLVALFRRMNLVVANDTGTMHLACYSDAPPVWCVGGRGQWGRFIPYEEAWIPCRVGKLTVCSAVQTPLCDNCDWRCTVCPKEQLTQHQVPCVAQVQVGDVVHSILQATHRLGA